MTHTPSHPDPQCAAVAVYLCGDCAQRYDGLGTTETDRLADATQRHADGTAELALVDHAPDFVLVAGPAMTDEAELPSWVR